MKWYEKIRKEKCIEEKRREENKEEENSLNGIFKGVKMEVNRKIPWGEGRSSDLWRRRRRRRRRMIWITTSSPSSFNMLFFHFFTMFHFIYISFSIFLFLYGASPSIFLRRLALAETFCLNCGILALDEPTTKSVIFLFIVFVLFFL